MQFYGFCTEISRHYESYRSLLDGTPWFTRQLFLVYSRDDVGELEQKNILPIMRDDLQLHYVTQTEAVRHNWTVDIIAGMIAECDRTVVFVTKRSLQDNCIHYKILMALEKCQTIKRTGVIVVLVDVDAEEVRSQFFGVLEDADHIYFNKNLANGIDKFRDQLLEKLKEIPQIFHTIPAERCSHIQFIIVMNSTKPVWELDHLDARIERIGQLPDTEEDKCYIYSILDEQSENKDIYYFVGHIPNVLKILHTLEMLGYSESEGNMPSLTRLKMTAGERSLQVSRFFFALNRLVNHPANEDCNSLACIIPYDDTADTSISMVDVLLDNIKCHVQAAHSRHRTIPNFKLWYSGMSLVNMNVGLIRPRASSSDFPTYIDVKKCLQRDRFIVHPIHVGSFQFPRILTRVMNRCKWIIIIASKESLMEKQSHILGLSFREILHKSVYGNQTKVILILDGLEEEDIPSELPAVTCISASEPWYLKTLMGTLKCMTIPVNSSLPLNIVDVHQGMAWDYVDNYLRKKLPDHVKELEHLQQILPDYIVCQKLYIIIPASCSVTSHWELDRDIARNLIDHRFERLSDPRYMQTKYEAASNKDSTIACPYWLQWDDEEYVVSIMFPDPLTYLRNMLDMAWVSELTEDQVRAEVWGFRQLTQMILDADPSLRDRAKLIFYDDKALNVYDIMSEVLDDEFEEQPTVL